MKKFLLLALFFSFLIGCAPRAVLTDYDPNYDFSAINAVNVVSNDSAEESPSANHIQSLVTQTLTNSGVSVSADAPLQLKITSFTEERQNEQSVSIGLGTGARSRNSSIGIGTSVQIPVGQATSDYQVIQLDLVDNGQVVWTTNDAARLRVKDGKGLHQVQSNIIEKLLANFPLIREETE